MIRINPSLTAPEVKAKILALIDEQAPDPNAAGLDGDDPEQKFREFLKSKGVADSDVETACDFLPRPGTKGGMG